VGSSLEEAESIMMLKTLAFTNGDVKKAAASSAARRRSSRIPSPTR
jgi:hypothetical protein